MPAGPPYSVQPRGIGKPDYSKEVSAARERRGLTLAYLQTLKIFTIVFTTEIQVVVLSPVGYVNCVPADIGRMVVDDGANTAILSAYDNTLRQWQIAWLTPVLAGSVMTITAGVGSGVALASVLNPYPWVLPPLAVGASASLIDTDTGDPMPFTVPLGYTATLVDFGMGLTEDAIMWTYMSGFLILNAGVYPGGNTYYENRIQSISTALIDPTGALSPETELRITNLGAGSLEGQIAVTGYLEAVGTSPLPTIKTVRCKFCGHKEEVPRETTNWICPKCEKLNIFYDLSKVREA